MRAVSLLCAGALLLAACGGSGAETTRVGESTTSTATGSVSTVSTTITGATTSSTARSATTTPTTTAGSTTTLQVLEPAPTTGLVGVYYYPWYGGDFHGARYLRRHLDPRQQPELGEYDDRRSDVIAQHLEWSQRAGIDVWVTSWWGRSSPEDNTIRNVILPHGDLGSTRIAVMYETPGVTSEYTNLLGIAGDFAHLAEHYFSHPAYFTIGGRPVVVVYLTRDLANEGLLETAVARMREGAAGAGFDVFVVGDHAFGEPRPNADIEVLDAITNYDVYGAMGATGHASAADVDRYESDQQGWRELAEVAGIGFIPAASPGFNDTAVRSGHDPLSRSLEGDEPGSLFGALLTVANDQRDSDLGDLVLINSWNEWHEDTQIEPVASSVSTSSDDSASGSAYTFDITYEGYGTRYLEILRDILGG